MKRFLLIFLIIFFSCSKTKKNFTPPSLKVEKVIESQIKTKGKLSCDNTNINIGEVVKGKEIKQNFIFKNIGSEPIEILGYEKSCSCTRLEASKYTLKPSETTTITMFVNTKEKTIGKHVISATLKTNGERIFYVLEASYYLIE